MKKAIILFVVFSCLILIWNLGLLFGAVASLLTIVTVVLMIDRYNYVMKINNYARRYENIYVVSNHIDTREEITLPEHIDALVVKVSYCKVHETIEKQKMWLTASKNGFYCDDGLTEKQRIKVIPIIFQDGGFVNETWDEFTNRVIYEIKEDRSKRHEMLKRENYDWYQKYSNLQHGVSWKKG